MITVVKNDEEGLIRTFNSLLSQTFKNWELIIVAGYSSDATLERGKQIESQDKRVTFLLEDSPGIYSAMNQGVLAATSDLVWFMNAGDCFFSNRVIARGIEMFKIMATDLIVGGHVVKSKNIYLEYNFSKRYFGKINFAFNRRYGCHQSMLFRKNKIKELGLFDLSFTYASDYDLVLKMIAEVKGFRDNQMYSLIEPGGAADSNLYKVHQEKYLIRNKQLEFLGAKILSYIWMQMACLKLSLRSKFPRKD